MNNKTIVTNWVTTGNLPPDVTVNQLLMYYINSTQEQKDELKNAIRNELPMCDWAYIGPLLTSMPANALWGVAVGIYLSDLKMRTMQVLSVENYH